MTSLLNNHQRYKKSRGFTLAEITIAILVLSTAMVVMISLQSASVENSFRDERRQVALLAARAIFSAIEIQERVPEDMDLEAPLAELIQKQEPLDKLTDWGDFKELAPYTGHLIIQNSPLPLKDIPEDALKRITLRVFWGNSPAESVELYYFIPKKDF